MLKFQSVAKKFPTGKPALEDISFNVGEGEFVFLTGPSGAGKTTLMKLLTRNINPSEGEILFRDADISSLRSNDLYKHKRQVGVIFQDYKLLNELNAWENIALALEIVGGKSEDTEERVTDLLKLVNLIDKAFLFPSQLSGGEAQRISIARALASAPSVIFADEPTGNLDPENSLAIVNLLKKINNLGTTVLIATHDQSLLDRFAKIRRINLKDGKIIEDTGKKDKKNEKKKKKKIIKNDEESKENKKDLEKEEKEEEKSKEENKDITKKTRVNLPKIKLPFGRKNNK